MSKSEVLMSSIVKFYTEDDNNMKILKGLLDKTSGISLRTLEWFITSYSKQNNLTYTTKCGRLFTVHCAYKSSLDGYSKKFFDPFCRTSKIDFDIESKKVKTTVAQLNFIRWCIKNNIIEYILDNKTEVLSTKCK